MNIVTLATEFRQSQSRLSGAADGVLKCRLLENRETGNEKLLNIFLFWLHKHERHDYFFNFPGLISVDVKWNCLVFKTCDETSVQAINLH